MAAGRSTAAILDAGLLGHLREVICWTESQTAGADFVSGSRAFGNRGGQVLAGPLLALRLQYPQTVYATGSNVTGSEFPHSLAVRYEFPRRGALPGVVLTWYDGGWAPPYESVDGIELAACGALYLGQQGQLLEDAITGRRVLLRDGQPRCELAAAGTRFGHVPWQSTEHRERVTAAVDAAMDSYRLRRRLAWNGPGTCARNSPEANILLRRAGVVCV